MRTGIGRSGLVFLAVLLCAALAACGKADVQPQPTEAAQAVTTEAAVTASLGETAAETEAAGENPILFLNVSQITFSVVGDSEDIYAGSAPRDEVNWTSEDESIIQVENGILTAAGVGSTTITAEYEDQKVTCQAGCLAATEEDFLVSHMTYRRSPMRIAPETPDSVLSFFEDAVMLGDSITYGFFKYEARNGRLGSPNALCRGGISLYSLKEHTKELSYRGKDRPIEEVLKIENPGKVFIMLGTNDLEIREVPEALGFLDTVLKRVKETCPDLEIYLESVLLEYTDTPAFNGKNEKILEYNKALQTYAQENGYHYVPVTPYLQDHMQGFAEKYKQDQHHPSYDGVCAWTDALRTYAYQQQIKGE